MIGADLEGLISPHDKSGLAVLLMFQQPHIASAALLPLLAVAVKLEELRTHLEHLLLGLFVCLGLDLLSKVNHRLEVDFR